MSKVIGGVIFDLGSTLIRFDGDWSALLQESLALLCEQLHEEGFIVKHNDFALAFESAWEAYDLQRQSDHIERSTAFVLKEVLKTFGYEYIDPAALERSLKRFYSVSEDHWQPMPGLHAVLDDLRGEGLLLGLISNAGDVDNVQRLIDKAEIRQYLDPIIISAAYGIRKPDPRLFNRVLDQWQLEPGAVVMVGDRLEADILGAQGVGIHQIWLQPADDVSSEAQITPEVVAEELVKVPALVRDFDAKG